MYFAPENKVAEKASSVSAGFLCTTKIGLSPTISILISPSLILGKNFISTNMPFGPSIYFSQNVRKS